MTNPDGSASPEELRRELVELLTNFEQKLREDGLREKVRALIPVHETLRDLGSSLVNAPAARSRILAYLRKFPRRVIEGEEIEVVAGISEWARRVRELRVEQGWPIVSGNTAKEMAHEGEFPVEDVDVERMRSCDYILLESRQDKKAAYRWNVANDIRKRELSMQDRLLLYLRENVGDPVTGEELRYVARGGSTWARRLRELRTEHGWPIATHYSGRPDLPPGTYVLERERQWPAHDRDIPERMRRRVLRRDDYRCQKCGWNHEDDWNPSDPRHLEVHHVAQHAHGGPNVPENLTTLCNICHDELHASTD